MKNSHTSHKSIIKTILFYFILNVQVILPKPSLSGYPVKYYEKRTCIVYKFFFVAYLNNISLLYCFPMSKSY